MAFLRLAPLSQNAFGSIMSRMRTCGQRGGGWAPVAVSAALDEYHGTRPSICTYVL